jgi:predicted ABC-type sugar transport system permease subunit
VLRAAFRDLPIRVGRLAQGLGTRLDDVAAWIIGAAVIVVGILVALGVATGDDLLNVIKKGLGLE